MTDQEGGPHVAVTNSDYVAVAAAGGSATVNVYTAAPPLDPAVTIREDVAAVLEVLGSKNVLYAGLDDELWRYVFESLHGLRNLIAEVNGKLRVRGPNDVCSTLRFMVRAISRYLADHEATYQRYLGQHGGFEPGWAHVEREWLLAQKGRPADDLLLLRTGLATCVDHLNGYADTGKTIDWPSEAWIARYWMDWARQRE